MRIFINEAPLDMEPGADVRTALRMLDPTLEQRVATGTALVTDARGIELDLGQRLSAGSILRVIIRSRRGGGEADADA
jgi:hypothetical protein